MTELPRCGVVIPTYNGAGLTTACLEALLTNPPSRCSWQIVVVDDGSTDGTPQALARFGDRITLVRQDANTGFARACNNGARAAGDCNYLVFLNNDTLPVAGWLDALVQEAQSDERIAAVGAKLLYPNGQLQHGGVVIGQDRWPHHLYAGFPGEHPAVNHARDMTALTAACLLIRREEFELFSGFDDAYHNGYEDIDLCLRLRERGHRIRYCPRSVVYHFESVTRWPSGVPEHTSISDQLFDERWRARLVPDDVQHYLEDGLLSVSYGPHYPVTMDISPDLAAVRTDGEELVGLERLLAARSVQVLELLSAETRGYLRGRHPHVAPQLEPAHPDATGRLLFEGREHQLGEGPSSRLISLVLPVKDGAEDLRALLPIVLGQSLSTRLEIVAVDSGSSDDTIEVLREFGATVVAIEPSEFDHGLTRNLCARHARGETLVFVNKRSRPGGKRWLAPLIAALDADPEAAAACSRVLAHPDADPLTTRDAERDFSGSPRRQRKQIQDWGEYHRMPVEERRSFLNFHTVSAAIRAEALSQFPFRSVRTIGEDLLWAREVLESGRALIHEPASLVHHSHPYTLAELFSRNVDDGIANRDINQRSFETDEIVPLIRAMVQDDWSYLRESLELSEPEVQKWQLESALRRTAQVAGQWIGVNYETLPEGLPALFSRVAQTRTAPSPQPTVTA